MSSRKRAFVDIETSYYVVPVWQTSRKQYVPPATILRWAKVICICWKWAGKKKVYSLTWDKEQNDRDMIAEFMKVMEEADEIVAHNGDRFDIKKIRTRCLKHRIPMNPRIVSIDTLKACKSLFSMHSNKLAEVAKFLGLEGKMETGGMQLWVDVIEHNSEAALKKMVRYCMRDVVLEEEVYDIMNPFMPVRSGLSSDIMRCNECGEPSLRANKRRRYTPMGSERITLRCAKKGCLKYGGTVAASKWDARVGA